VALAVGVAFWGAQFGQAEEPKAAPKGAPATGVPVQAPNAPVKTRLKEAWDNLDYLHNAGGGCMWGIDAGLIVGVAFVLERFVRMRRKHVLPIALLNDANAQLDKGDLDGLREVCRKHKRSTLNKILSYLAGSKGASRDEREATVNELASRDMDMHRLMCLPLAAITGISPLIGLLGTVVGIRECFRDVALAGEMGNPAMLAGGIEKALITTIYGLVVAITTLFFYNMFKFRINLIANELEEVLSGIMGRRVFSSEPEGQ
jgi:biopolymer transport protein ExbB